MELQILLMILLDNGSVTVKVTAKQDNEDENNPEEAILKTVVLQDGKVECYLSCWCCYC